MSDRAMYQANAVVHFDISGADDDALRRFHGGLLDWHVDPKGPGYALVHTPGGLAGSIVGDSQPGATQVSSGAFPRFARNPGTGESRATATTLVAADQSVHHDPRHPSAIILPIRTITSK